MSWALWLHVIEAFQCGEFAHSLNGSYIDVALYKHDFRGLSKCLFSLSALCFPS